MRVPDPLADNRRWTWWLAAWTAGVAVAIGLSTPWQWLPGGLPPADPTAGLAAGTLARIADYRNAAVPVGLASTALSLLLAAVLGLTPLGARLVEVLPGRRHRWLHRVVAVAVLSAVGTTLTLPLRAVAEYLTRRAGLSTRTWGSWAGEVATSYALTTAVTAAVLLAIAGAAARLRRWVLPVSLGAGVVVLLGSLVYPLLVEPLYASFTSMPAGPLRTSLVALAARDGITVDDVLVVDASQRTSTVNAYVSGFGPTRRIVVYDTLLAQAPPREIRLVVAHELGHAAHDDVLRGTLIGAAGAVAAVTALLALAGSASLRRRGGLSADGDARDTVTAVAGVPLILALVALGSFAVLPLTNVVSRAVEARADLHALQLTGDPAGYIALQQQLAASNLSDPAPPAGLQWWFGSHPSTSQRVALVQGWAAQHGRDDTQETTVPGLTG